MDQTMRRGKVDRSNHTVFIDSSGGLTPEVELLSLVAQAKGFVPDLAVLEPQFARPCISFRGAQVEYLVPCVDLIAHSRPLPQLLPEDAPTMALVKMFTMASLDHTPFVLDMAYTHYVDRRSQFCGLTRPHLSLLDLFVAAHGKFQPQSSWSQMVRAQVLTRIAREEVWT